jgi:hypothetical protein
MCFVVFIFIKIQIMIKHFLFSVILLFTLNSFGQGRDQPSQKGIRYVYSETTPEAYDELILLTKKNAKKRGTVEARIKELEKSGKIILSSAQFKPISTRIRASESLPDDDSGNEGKAYASDAKKRYVPIKNLIK